MENTTNLKGTYAGNQTPIERLRNLLTPFITLAELLNRDSQEELQKIGVDINDLIEVCNTNKQSIHNYLSDCEHFYNGNLWEFCYSECYHEATPCMISLHRTQKGAEIAMAFHKEKLRQQWEESHKDGNPFNLTFGMHDAWIVREVVVKE